MTKVLIVDDDHGYRESLVSVMPAEGYEVRTAANAAAAMRIAEEFVPDVLIVDWLLRGGHDGFEVILALRDRNSALKVILMTGYPNTTVEERLKEFPHSSYLRKPFSAEDILKLLNE